MKSKAWCSRKCVYNDAAEKCARFDVLGIPNTFMARIAASYFNESLFHKHLSNEKSQEIAQTFVRFVSARDYSQEAISELFRQRDVIITEPFKELSKKLALESAKALSSFDQSLDSHMHKLSDVEAEVLELFERDAPKEEILALVRRSFAEVKATLEMNLDKLKSIALIDATSGLANRRSFDATLTEALKEHQATGMPIGLAMFDIDDFKKFNDIYGHRVGDQGIALVAREIRKTTEAYEDAHTRFFPSRYGGEEFAIIASGPKAQLLPLLAEKTREAITSFNFLIRDASGNILVDNVHLSVSGGVVLYSLAAEELLAETIIEEADKALYIAKKQGKNRVFMCSKCPSIPYILLSR